MKKITIPFCNECPYYLLASEIKWFCEKTGKRLPNVYPVTHKDDPTGTVYYGILIPKECPLEDDYIS
jgi:hypothetical protein